MTDKTNNVLVVQNKPKDHPFKVIVEVVRIHALRGRLCYQKFSCSKCGQRLTMETPNVLYKTASCDQCQTVTDIEKQGCNFMLEMHNKTLEQVYRVIAGKEDS